MTKVTAFYVIHCLLIWNQGLESAKQVLVPSRIRRKMCSTFMEESSPLQNKVCKLKTGIKYIWQNSFQAFIELRQERKKENQIHKKLSLTSL